MSVTLIVSFHGGSSGHHNLHTYPGGAKILPTGSGDPSLTNAELRGFSLGPDGNLYVVNGFKDSSEILQYQPKGDGTYHNGKVWATDHLDHPFDAVWGPDGNLYVSNQDPSKTTKQIRITVYSGAGKFLGVFAEGFKVLRGITWVGKTLWAADENGGSGSGAVIAFALQSGTTTGKATGVSIAVSNPVHVLYDRLRYMYIGSGSGNCVYACDMTQTKPAVGSPIVSSTATVPINGTSGLAIVTDGGTQHLYVGSRKDVKKANQPSAINQYQLNSTVHPPVVSNGKITPWNLGDDPEFAGVLGSGVFN